MLSLVPLLATCFALFTRFPVFRRFKDAIQDSLLSKLLPDDIARTVLRYLDQFAANASGLTWFGSLFLLGTAIALLVTIENALNQMWEVRRNRPLLRRVGLYLLALVAGPPLLGLGLWASAWLIGISRGLVAAPPPALVFLLDLGPLLLSSAAVGCLLYYLPNTKVPRSDAVIGGIVAGIAFEIGKRAFAAYLNRVPTYRAIYGAFAVLPIFLLWVYVSWLIVLLAAMLTANLARLRRQRPG